MERVVVFGGYDFVGYHLCDFLVNEGIETHIIDDGKPTPLQMERFDKIGRNALLVRNQQNEDFDEPIDAVYFILYKSKYIKAQLERAVTIVEKNNAKMIIVSSINDNEFEEQVDLDDINYNIVKVPYIYGPLCEEDCVIKNMIVSKLQNKEIKLHPSLPNYLYVEDLVAFLFQLGSKENINEKIIYYLSGEEQQLKKLKEWFGIKTTKVEELVINPKSHIIRDNNCLSIIDGLTKTEHYVKQKINRPN